MNKVPKERQVLRVRMDEMAAQEEAEVLERKETWYNVVYVVVQFLTRLDDWCLALSRLSGSEEKRATPN